MAIAAGFNAQIMLSGDGTSTTVSLDLTQIPFVFMDGSISRDFSLQGIRSSNPSSVMPLSLDDSTKNLPTAALTAQDTVLLTFPDPLAAGLHQLTCAVLF